MTPGITDTLPEKYHTANIVKRYQGFCDAESENKETVWEPRGVGVCVGVCA